MGEKLFSFLDEAVDAASVRQAKENVKNGPDREERQRLARMSDSQIAREKAEEYSDERQELENSNDPIDRQILNLMRQKRLIDEKLEKLRSQKEKGS